MFIVVLKFMEIVLKKEMMIRVNRGFEYIDYTPLHRNDDNLYKKV